MSLPATVGSVTPAARESAIESLKQLLGDRLSTAASMRELHGKDASYHPCVPPDAVAFAQSTEEVSEIVKVCGRHKVPIIPFGTGTGMEGNVVALRGGVCIDISRMNRILQVSVGDYTSGQVCAHVLAAHGDNWNLRKPAPDNGKQLKA